jgi:hypothetical protein
MDIIKNIYSAFDTSNMNWPTLVPEWIIQDAIVLILAALTIGFIIKHEKKPAPILLEFFCFLFLYAGIYENLASVMGWYGFGRSIVMVFNVPLTVPIIEYLFVYTTLRFCEKIKLPKWCAPILAGCFGVIADLPLDPLAMQQRATGNEGTIGRWTWFIAESDAQVLEVPIYNFTGWMLLCGYASIFIVLGRHWFKKSGEKKWVGIAYPPLCLLAGLATMCSPLSSLLLWLGPWCERGSNAEYLMLGLCFVAFFALLIAWRGRMRKRLTWKEDWAIPVVFGVFHLSVLLFGVIGGYWKVVLFGLPFAALQMGTIAWGFLSKKVVDEPEKSAD